MAGSTEKPLILLGGTFDPPHIGHLVLGECARVQFGAERVIFMPAGEPYRKRARAVTAAEHRLAMTRIAVAGNGAFEVDDREVRRPGPTYTVDTLDEMHAEGLTDLILVLGSDAIADMPNWKAPGRIRALAAIAVAVKVDGERRGSGTDPVVAMPPIAISSTLIRERVRRGEPIRYLVPDGVAQYIAEHGLYRE